MKKNYFIQTKPEAFFRLFLKVPLTMRIIFLLLICVIFQAGAKVAYSQSKQISLDLQNVTVEDALNTIEEQSEFYFLYNSKLVDVDRKVNVKAKNQLIFSVLDGLFASTDVTYRVEDRQIILSRKKWDTPVAASQQAGKQITGRVTDASGEPIIGANIVEKGGAVNGTITDADGNFSLSVSPGATLTVSFIGYVTQEIAVRNQTQLQITLQENLQALEEVVVVGYGVQKKRDLTGAVSSVKIAEMPVQTYSTVSHALAGKAAGLQVRQISAQAGGGTWLRIRGETSTGAGNDPLIIIDGFPVSSTATETSGLGTPGSWYSTGSMDNMLESLNPNDIESIEVLKDASATAIYGSRAGHGVIIGTTKRGKQEKVSVTYSGLASVQNIRKNYELLDAKEYMIARNKTSYETYLKTNGLDIYGNYITMPAGHVTPIFYPLYSYQQIAGARTTDWMGEVTRTGLQQSHNLSMTGGSESTQYMASVNYFSQDGVIKSDAMKRFTTRFNLDQRLSRYVKAGLTFSINRNQNNTPVQDGNYSGIISGAMQFNPTVPVFDENGKYSVDPVRAITPNPVSLLEITDYSIKDRLMGMAYVEAEPVKGLLLKASLGADRRHAKRNMYLPKTTVAGAQTGGFASISEIDNMDYLMDLTATYTKEINRHNFTVLAGYSYQEFNDASVSANNQDFILDAFLYNNLGAGAYARPGVGSGANKSALGSYFGRLNYSFLGKYLFTATVRADGSSNFLPENRWGYFPSASLGWRFGDEAFMESFSSWLSNGKLRVGYGQTGNSNVGNRILSTYWPGYNSVLGESFALGIRPGQLGNPNLKWETTTELNVGLDLGFLNNRVNLAAEYYDRTVSDLLVTNKSLLSYHEITTIAANIGKTQGRGVELTLNTVNVAGKDLQWTTDVTYSFYRDRWKERDPEWKPAVYQAVDDPIRAMFSYESDGLLQAGETPPEHQKTLLPGQVKLKDLSGEDGVPDGKINDYDVVYMGTSDPAFLFGFNNTLRYKSFDLNIYFYGEVNRRRGLSGYIARMYSITTDGDNVSKEVLNAWYHNNQGSKYTSIIASDYGTGDYYTQLISYARCRNITLGYTLPLSKKIVNRARIYADLNNPFIFTNWTGLDPETDSGSYSFSTSTQGFSHNPNSDRTFQYPNVTSVSFGVDITF